MLTAEFFARSGLFVEQRFLDRESCARLCAEMRASELGRMTIGDGSGDVLDEASRATFRAKVSAESVASVRGRLMDLKGRVEDHFGVPLRDCQAPQFLVYRPGDFYVAHTDGGVAGKSPAYVVERRVSVVAFLNGPSEDGAAASYRGGALTFSGLIDDERLKSAVYPLLAEPGLLIAFRSETVHGVAPVTHGERYTIASWYV